MDEISRESTFDLLKVQRQESIPTSCDIRALTLTTTIIVKMPDFSIFTTPGPYHIIRYLLMFFLTLIATRNKCEAKQYAPL